MDDMLILFGAGVYAKKYTALLEYLNMEFDYFTDNDASKWGTILYGKRVIAPDELRKFSRCRIIVSSTHEMAIRKQLSDMGMERDIIGLDALYNLCEQRMSKSNYTYEGTSSKETVLVDMYEGIGWGGTELWAANLAYGLKNMGEKVILLGGVEQPELERQYEDLTERISEKGTISYMTALMERNLPCVLINNFAGCAFVAAIILKRKYPGLVKTVSVIHNDNKSLFDAHMMFAEYTDKVFCVSRQICQHMRDIYDYDAKCYDFKAQPVEMELAWERNANQSNAVRIGYAARLVRQQKRADLLVDLIALLEQRGFDYVLQIAGEGECLEGIEKYIVERDLGVKVQLTGRLSKSQMGAFWKNQDIFVNISEYEGTSLSMLEAMGYGCVPVVTDVSGAREFIEHGKNGYICDIGDMEGIVDCITRLATNREMLRRYGENCRVIIQEQCNQEAYIAYWKEKVLGEWA